MLKLQRHNVKGKIIKKEKHKSTCFRRNEQKASSNFRSTPSDAMRHSHIDFALLIYTSKLNIMLYQQMDYRRNGPIGLNLSKDRNEVYTISFCLPENPTAI